MPNSSLPKYPQLDLIKGLAIISVIVSHSAPENYLLPLHRVWYIAQAVPVFFIIYGITTAISLNREQDKSLTSIFNKDYFIRKAIRYYLPFLPLCIITIVSINIFYYNTFDVSILLHDVFLSFLGKFPPYGGTGDYFISDLIQLMIVAPILYVAFKRRPSLFLIVAIVANVLFELIAPSFSNYDFMYRRCIMRYLGAVALGVYLSEDFLKNNIVNIFEKKNVFTIPFFIFSFAYLLYFKESSISFMRPEWGTENVLSFFYPLGIVIVLLNYYNALRKVANRAIEFIRTIGIASYHIFVVQIPYFAFIGPYMYKYLNQGNRVQPSLTSEYLIIIFNIIILLGCGVVYYYAESYLSNKLKRYVSAIG